MTMIVQLLNETRVHSGVLTSWGAKGGHMAGINARRRDESESACRVVEDDGNLWVVFEHVSVAGDRSLVFESPGCMRRFYTYPAAWQELTDEKLIGLSNGAN